jgi:hypothetical protein
VPVTNVLPIGSNKRGSLRFCEVTLWEAGNCMSRVMEGRCYRTNTSASTLHLELSVGRLRADMNPAWEHFSRTLNSLQPHQVFDGCPSGNGKPSRSAVSRPCFSHRYALGTPSLASFMTGGAGHSRHSLSFRSL